MTASSTKTRPWRDVLSIHPAADAFPLMSKDELIALAKDIEANGLMHKVVITGAINPDGTANVNQVCVLDGRNRLDALEHLGKELFDKKGRPSSEWFTNQFATDAFKMDELVYVISANIHRRHLTADQRRELIEKLLKANPEQSNRQIAAVVKRDHKTVSAVRTELEGRGEIPHVSITTDTKGRKQPAKRAAQPRAFSDLLEGAVASCVGIG